MTDDELQRQITSKKPLSKKEIYELIGKIELDLAKEQHDTILALSGEQMKCELSYISGQTNAFGIVKDLLKRSIEYGEK